MDGLTSSDNLPRAVLFDWDNTLVDNWGCIQAALNVALIEYGMVPWTLQEARARLKLSPRDALPTIFGADWQRAKDIFYAEFEQRHLDHLQPLPDAQGLLECLRENGIYLAVVSNKTGRFLRREADHLGWSSYFGRIVGSADAVADKPDAAPAFLALGGSGVEAGRDVWFVGDTDVDMECARNAGCLPVLIDNGVLTAEEQGRAAASICLPSCDALTALVQQRLNTISAHN